MEKCKAKLAIKKTQILLPFVNWVIEFTFSVVLYQFFSFFRTRHLFFTNKKTIRTRFTILMPANITLMRKQSNDDGVQMCVSH